MIGTKSEISDGKIGGTKFSHLDFPSNNFDMSERAWGGGGVMETLCVRFSDIDIFFAFQPPFSSNYLLSYTIIREFYDDRSWVGFRCSRSSHLFLRIKLV